LWTILITYRISIPLGIMKAVRDGSRFDLWISAAIWPAVWCRAFWLTSDHGDRRRQLFLDIPLRGLASDNWAALLWLPRLVDHFWPVTLPTTALVNWGFAT
jgi:microcin C transport system permease protein